MRYRVGGPQGQKSEDASEVRRVRAQIENTVSNLDSYSRRGRHKSRGKSIQRWDGGETRTTFTATEKKISGGGNSKDYFG